MLYRCCGGTESILLTVCRLVIGPFGDVRILGMNDAMMLMLIKC